MTYTIKIQTPYDEYYLHDYSLEDKNLFLAHLQDFLINEDMAFFNIIQNNGEILLPFQSLINSEITIY
jgi:hypothetical protein